MHNPKNSKCLFINFPPFTNINAPVVSPYNPLNSSELNLSLIPPYASDLVSQGVTGIYLCGTTGESVSLSLSERKLLLETWLNTAEYKGKLLRILPHIGHHCLKDTIELASHAVNLGLEALAIMPPSFFRPQNEQETAEYIVEIAKQFPKTAIFYYHFPSMTNVRINLAKMLEIANKEASNIVGAKFSDIDLIDLANCAAKGYNMLVGNDALFLQGLISGASGLIAVQCNYNAIFPKEIWNSVMKGDLEKAIKFQEKSREFVALVRSFGVTGAVTREAMKVVRGLDSGGVRLPQKGIAEKEKERFKEEIEKWLRENKE